VKRVVSPFALNIAHDGVRRPLVAVLPGGVLTDIAVIDVVGRRRDFAKQEERPLPESVGVFANIRAEAGTGQFAHVFHGIDAEAVDIGFVEPMASSSLA
jgi:hypothetical protein